MIKTIKEKITPISVSIDSEFEYNKKINIISLFEFISNYLGYTDYLVLNDGKTDDVVIYYSEIDEIINYGSYNFDIDKKKLNSIIKSKNSHFNTRMQYYNFEIHFEEYGKSISERVYGNIIQCEDYDDQFYKDLERQLYYTFDLDKMYVEHMNKIISYLDQSNGCSCDIGKYITISPTGIEDCCTALSQTDYRIDNQLAQERCSSEDCQHCKYFYMCDGGCRYERYLAFGNDWPNKHLNATCKIMKIWHDSIERFLSQCRFGSNKPKLRELITRYKWWG